MKRLIAGVVMLMVVVATAGPRAQAATLSFAGTLSLQIDPRFVPSVVIPGSGVASVAADGSLHLLSFGLVGGTFGPFTGTLDHAAATVGPVRLTSIGNLSGSFSGLSSGPAGGGTMGLTGLAKICFVQDPPCTYVNVPIPLALTSGGAGLGVGGSQFATGAASVTVQHDTWAVGPRTVTIHNPSTTITTPGTTGFVHGPASLTSSAAQVSGVVQLVTVSKAFTTVTSVFPELPILATLNLHFVPEPSMTLLVGAGIVILGIGSRRNKRSSTARD